MKYEKSAVSSGISSIVWGVGFLVATIAVQVFWFPIPMPVLLFCLFFIAVCVGVGVMMIRNGGSWKITINHDGIDWSSPNESVDPSFQIAMEDLDRVETRIRKRAGKGNSVSYVLVSHSGAEQKLGAGSGINLKDVVAELERLGVKHDVIRKRGASFRVVSSSSAC